MLRSKFLYLSQSDKFDVKNFPQNFHCIEYISYHSRFLSNSALTLKNRIHPELFHCIEYAFHSSGFLSNLHLPWIRCIEYIFFTVTCGEVRYWGGTVSSKAKFAKVWIEWSSINSPLNWLLAEWLMLMLSTPYHNLLHTYRHNGDSRFEKITLRRTNLTWLVYHLFNSFTKYLKQSYNLYIRLECMQWSNRECRPSV